MSYEKICTKCNQKLSIECFRKDAKGVFGRQARCRACRSADDKLITYDHEKRKAAKIRYYNSEKGIAERKRRQDRIRGSEKIVAHSMVAYAIKTGRLIPKSCELCGAENSDAHHDDYSKPLDVIWLCRKHHAKRHKEMAFCD